MNRGTNSLGQQGTCDCGACAHSYDASGYCAPIRTPPSPPAPSEEVIKGLDPFAPPGPEYINKQVWEQSCECNCAGQGTCKYTPAVGDLDAVNQVSAEVVTLVLQIYYSSLFIHPRLLTGAILHCWNRGLASVMAKTPDASARHLI